MSQDGNDKAVGKREPPHGTYYRYVHWTCRCEDCRRANAEQRRKERAQKVKG